MNISDAHKGFIEDTDKILDRLQTLFTQNPLSIPKIYREVHSLKGAAGFAGLKSIETLAHKVEVLLLSIRDGILSLDSSIEEVFFNFLDYCVKDINNWRSVGEEIDSSELVSDINKITPNNEPISIEVVENKDNTNSFFSGFEMDLLTEAMHRGEKFYKVHCRIDTDEEMKYPRLFLIINNLEKISNVIKIHPGIDEINKNLSQEITLFLTTSKPRSDIYQGLSLDRIKEVELLRVDFNNFIDIDIDNNNDKSLYGSTIDIERGKIEEILNYAQDLHNKLLVEDFVVNEKRNVVEKLLTGMKNSLTSLTDITVSRAFSPLKSYVKSLAAKLDKEVSLIIKGEDVLISREKAQILKDVLLQLIKNSIDHGIESREERIQNGKDPKGSITLKFTLLDNSITISLSDDGRGIHTKNVIKKAVSDNFISQHDEISILSLISQPGFSTAREVSKFSGRGIGLDIVINKIFNELDGKVKLDNSLGNGVCFHILIPTTSSVKKYTLFKFRDKSYGVSITNTAQKINLDNNKIEIGENRALFYRLNGGLIPIFTPQGRLSSNTKSFKEKFALVVRYLGKKALFLVDEFAVEKEFFASTISFEKTEIPGHKRVILNKQPEDFILLEPSIINL